jgi:Leucine-rich repeat (LRR) protein
LGIRRNNISNEGAEALDENAVLTELSIPGNDIGDKGVKALAQSKTLRHLDIEGNYFGEEGIEALAENRVLTSLNMWTAQMAVKIPKSFLGNSTLTSLKVKIFDDGNVGILATLPNLTKLDIPWNESGMRIESLEALVRSTSLQILNIAGNLVGDKGAVILTKCRSLTSLDVSYNDITRKGIQFLMENLPLTYLDISSNPGSDVWEEIVDAKLELINNHSKLGSLLSSFLICRLPSDLERLILDYCKPLPFLPQMSEW